jgi:hypothetical protein
MSRRKRAPRTKVEVQPARKIQRSSGTVSVTHHATGIPEDVAHFFRSLAQ